MTAAPATGPADVDRGRQLVGIGILLVVTAIWGTTFPLVKRLTDLLDPTELLFLRFGVAGAVALPVLLRRRPDGAWWQAAAEFGFLGWLGYAAQTAGLAATSAGRSAFITSLSVLGVPLLAALAGRPPHRRVWPAVAVAVAGTFLLANDGGPPNRGDALTLITAASYSVYILRLELWVRRVSSARLMAAQTLGVLPFAAAALLLSDPTHWPHVAGGQATLQLGTVWPLLIARWSQLPLSAWRDLVYLGTVGLGLTAGLQALGQARVAAAQAALIFTTEPVWAALFAGLWLGERLGPRGLGGGLLILLGAWLGQGLRLRDLLPGGRSG